MLSLKDLARDDNIVISSSDKGGGVVILDRSTYEAKMNELLSDNTTYEEVPAGSCKKASDKFNKEARKLLRRSDRGKRLQYHLEETPRSARMRGLPKLRKEGLPMRPITSGVASVPQRLAKCIAKPLSAALGSISCLHLKNSADLLDRLRDIDVRGKRMVSFDVKSPFTNVSVGAMGAVRRVLQGIDDAKLPLPKEDFIGLVQLCVSFGSFHFANKEFVQKNQV